MINVACPHSETSQTLKIISFGVLTQLTSIHTVHDNQNKCFSRCLTSSSNSQQPFGVIINQDHLTFVVVTASAVAGDIVDVKIKTEVEEDEEDLKQLDSSTWKCSICSRTFQTKWKGEDHVAAHRALPGGVTCLMCGRTYQDRLFFAVHMSNKHKKPLS